MSYQYSQFCFIEPSVDTEDGFSAVNSGGTGVGKAGAGVVGADTVCGAAAGLLDVKITGGGGSDVNVAGVTAPAAGTGSSTAGDDRPGRGEAGIASDGASTGKPAGTGVAGTTTLFSCAFCTCVGGPGCVHLPVFIHPLISIPWRQEAIPPGSRAIASNRLADITAIFFIIISSPGLLNRRTGGQNLQFLPTPIKCAILL
ncbi:hypothetical protein [Desulfofundulus sp.]|uniref:hypothetical protein n=1 Tax=Desulfofundulus sp. TaxID=2282750 RepID=UPI003C709837